ncbi:hypothetical protein A4G20_10620 [Pasteurellaceae bacterium RH1A]|nr:hypothetical protein A4G20_10620 [Pasteurellaceae bacterium RH1A]
MTNPICAFSFSLKGWHIVTSKQLSPQDWQAGETHWQAVAQQLEDFAPKLAFMPPLKRRRLSPSARLFFEAAWDLCGEEANFPVVYASCNSEINRNFALWHSLLTEGDLSPTSFSLSVHNALVGQWSEARQVKAETTAITALQDNLETALLEAYLLLNDGADKVLVVVAEDPLDEKYNAQPVYRQPFAYALAMVVEKGSQYFLRLQHSDQNQPLAKDNALYWVQQQYLDQQEWQTKSSRGGVWHWQKN